MHENVFILLTLLNDRIAKYRNTGSKFIPQIIYLLLYIVVIKKPNIKWSFLDRNGRDKLPLPQVSFMIFAFIIDILKFIVMCPYILIFN